MFTREFTLGEAGIHAAIASALMRIAKAQKVPIYLSRLNGQAAPLSQQLRVISLCVKPFETVIVIVNTPDSEVAERVFEQTERALAERSPR